jgi:hypothetical protein
VDNGAFLNGERLTTASDLEALHEVLEQHIADALHAAQGHVRSSDGGTGNGAAVADKGVAAAAAAAAGTSGGGAATAAAGAAAEVSGQAAHEHHFAPLEKVCALETSTAELVAANEELHAHVESLTTSVSALENVVAAQAKSLVALENKFAELLLQTTNNGALTAEAVLPASFVSHVAVDAGAVVVVVVDGGDASSDQERGVAGASSAPPRISPTSCHEVDGEMPPHCFAKSPATAAGVGPHVADTTTDDTVNGVEVAADDVKPTDSGDSNGGDTLGHGRQLWWIGIGAASAAAVGAAIGARVHMHRAVLEEVTWCRAGRRGSSDRGGGVG